MSTLATAAGGSLIGLVGEATQSVKLDRPAAGGTLSTYNNDVCVCVCVCVCARAPV